MPDLFLDWILTYLLHSSVALGLVFALSLFLFRRHDALAELEQILWKAALIGPLVSATLVGVIHERTSIPEHWQAHIASTSAQVLSDSVEEATSTQADPSNPQQRRTDTASGWHNHVSYSLWPETESVREFNLQAATSDVAPVANEQEQTDQANALLDISPTLGQYESDNGAATENAAGAIAAWPMRAIIESIIIVCILLGLIRLACDVRTLRQALHTRTRVHEGEVRSLLDELMQSAGLADPVHLAASTRLAVPMALSVPQHEICLPQQVMRHMTRPVQRAVLAHELAHIARRDPAWQMATRIIQCILFFQPLNAIAARRIQTLAEDLADRQAMRWLGTGVDLADGLTAVAGWLLNRRSLSVNRQAIPMVAAMVQEQSLKRNPSELRRRIHRLLHNTNALDAGSATVGRWTAVSRCAACMILCAGLIVFLPGLTAALPQVHAGEDQSQFKQDDEHAPHASGIAVNGELMTDDQTSLAHLQAELDALNDEVTALRTSLDELRTNAQGRTELDSLILQTAARIDQMEQLRDQVRRQAGALQHAANDLSHRLMIETESGLPRR